MTSSLDDQQERHYIGNLLCEEDVFVPTNSCNIETGGNNSNISSGNVMPSSGPIGPTPNRTFWPEPPPPYSPCYINSPQWTSLSHQAPELLAPLSAALSYGQAPTATAVTRTDFYQSPYGRRDEWENVSSAAVDAFMSSAAFPYAPRQTVSVLKSLMTKNNTVDNMHQHHYKNIYRHHQQHLGSAPPDRRLFTVPPPPSLPRVYSDVDESSVLHLDPFLPQHLPPKEAKKTANKPTHVENISLNLLPSEVLPKTVALPLGKSYRDAASKKEHVISNALSGSNPPSSVRHTLSLSGSKDKIVKSVPSLPQVNSIRQSNNENTHLLKTTAINVAIEKDKKTIHCVTNRVPTKKGPGSGNNIMDNEFQKITHKKNKATRTNKNDSVIADEDGLTGNQVVDASSRFDILQSLGSQTTNTTEARSTHQSVSSIEDRTECPSVDTVQKPKNEESEKAQKNNTNAKALADDKIKGDNQSVVKRPSLSSAQRNVLKKPVGTRREGVLHSSADANRCGRKQRNAAKKHVVVTFIFSIIKSVLQWVMYLVLDISVQLWDITLYTIVTGYKNIVSICRRLWYSMLDSMRKFWESIRLSNIKKIWTHQVKVEEWGLSDNIQLPVTGDEAIERILKCRGRDAYVILGVRADCKDDEIKRYYKKQAVLVHPDKNCSSGADEAFKILSKAFDAISTPEVRNKYNIANVHKNPLHKEMEELWERLRQKVNEARNAMYCDCGSKHTRIPIEGIRASEARYCKKCRVRHPAKHNDIWAETRLGGFVWVYYACLDGVVYDITQWATCSSNHLKHLKANSHVVQYRLVTANGSAFNKNSSQRARIGRQRNYNNLCSYNQGVLAGDGCACSVSLGYNDLGAKSQQASYRPPERTSLNGDGPRRAGRRRKQR
ncbi:unnamed protein product [Thelazia callipaeda]|uniref:J domain-containing protein n=1 Tax=Thelazia callipaeda TaxID=103827 RepID=A0A158RBY2_THECL|nr:unnamed protein product [Thelazia callipaeda]